MSSVYPDPRSSLERIQRKQLGYQDLQSSYLIERSIMLLFADLWSSESALAGGGPADPFKSVWI